MRVHSRHGPWLWGIAYGLCLIMALVFVWPQYTTYRRLEAACLKSRQRLAHLSVAPVHPPSVPAWTLMSDAAVQQTFLNALNALVQQQVVTLISLRSEGLTYDATLEGQYAPLLHVLQRLNLQPFGVWISRISLQAIANAQLQLSLTLKLLPLQWSPSRLAPPTSLPIDVHPPLFCRQSAEVLQRQWPLDWLSIHHMRMVGYVAEGDEQQALIQLPDANILMVRDGMVLGKEHGVVTLIEPARVIVTLPRAPFSTWTLTLRP